MAGRQAVANSAAARPTVCSPNLRGATLLSQGCQRGPLLDPRLQDGRQAEPAPPKKTQFATTSVTLRETAGSCHVSRCARTRRASPAPPAPSAPPPPSPHSRSAPSRRASRRARASSQAPAEQSGAQTGGRCTQRAPAPAPRGGRRAHRIHFRTQALLRKRVAKSGEVVPSVSAALRRSGVERIKSSPYSPRGERRRARRTQTAAHPAPRPRCAPLGPAVEIAAAWMKSAEQWGKGCVSRGCVLLSSSAMLWEGRSGSHRCAGDELGEAEAPVLQQAFTQARREARRRRQREPVRSQRQPEEPTGGISSFLAHPRGEPLTLRRRSAGRRGGTCSGRKRSRVRGPRARGGGVVGPRSTITRAVEKSREGEMGRRAEDGACGAGCGAGGARRPAAGVGGCPAQSGAGRSGAASSRRRVGDNTKPTRELGDKTHLWRRLAPGGDAVLLHHRQQSVLQPAGGETEESRRKVQVADEAVAAARVFTFVCVGVRPCQIRSQQGRQNNQGSLHSRRASRSVVLRSSGAAETK